MKIPRMKKEERAGSSTDGALWGQQCWATAVTANSRRLQGSLGSEQESLPASQVVSVARSKQVCIEWMEATVLFPVVSIDNE